MLNDEDPCTRLARLRKVREALITGAAVIETAFDGNTVRYAKADLPALERLILEAEGACARSLGDTSPPRRRRFAMGARFRPY